MKNFKNFKIFFKILFLFFWIGIIACGNIGSRVAKVAKQGFNMRVLGADKFPEYVPKEGRDNIDEIICTDNEADMDKFVSDCDFILNVAPLTSKTRGMYNKDFFAKMKETAYFMNIGRGPSVVEEDLIEACKTRQIAGAYLDVFAQEPLPENSPFWDVENIDMTFHSLHLTNDTLENFCSTFNTNLERFLEGEELINIIDKEGGL